MPEYKISLEAELSEIKKNLKPYLTSFITKYPKYTTVKFYQLCSYTHSSLYTLPQDFPTNLKVADNPQIAAFYSNLSRTYLLNSLNYTSSLLTSSLKRTNIFTIYEVDNITLLEQRIELYNYLLKLFPKNKKSSIKKIPQMSKNLSLTELYNRISKLEKELLDVRKILNK
jgi:hypothetical protein